MSSITINNNLNYQKLPKTANLKVNDLLNSTSFIIHFREKCLKQNIENTFSENVLVCENFLSTLKKTRCKERFLGGLRKMLSLCKF